MIVLGINAFHGDSAACVMKDGKLVAAVEEERFTRVKHWAGFPIESIRYCLAAAGARLSDVGCAAINQDARANLVRKVLYTLSHRQDPSMIIARMRRKRARARVEAQLESCFPAEKFAGMVHHVEHHLAHLGSAFLVSPFPEAVAVSVDGFGDFASAGWGAGRGHCVSVDDRVYFPHSLGLFYESITRHLGFTKYGDEYKVMGLAPYGEPTYLPRMREMVRLREDGKYQLELAYFRHHDQAVEYQWEGGEPVMGNVASHRLAELLGPARKLDGEITQAHRDIARSAQAMYEEAFFHLLRQLHARYGLDSLALAGGCAMNSVANGKVYANTPFKKLYVQSAPGDAGGAVGAACIAWSRQAAPEDLSARFRMEHAYWGPEFDSEAIASALRNRACEMTHECQTIRVSDSFELCRRTAEAIARGCVVGWFQGRMEWGPRALGNRSILGDPRRNDMQQILNSKIKRRESFRPFAPSVLREAVSVWFELDDDVPFMTQVFPIRPEQRSRIPAVTHIDGSGRLQTVDRHANALYYQLIEAFEKITGVPMLLNTSFNENEPVVCRPDEALDCFLRTRMDVLVMGPFFVSRMD